MFHHVCKKFRCGRYLDEARWSGANNGHCTICGELFIGDRAFQRHIIPGTGKCKPPGEILTKKGEPLLERVEKPDWSPPYAWRQRKPDDQKHWMAREKGSV
jgi:hypothetical protein